MLLVLFAVANPVLLLYGSTERGLPRTAAVLFQNLAYRSTTTDRDRRLLAAVDQRALTLKEPRYSFGYLWPHMTAHALRSPEQTREEVTLKAIDARAAAIHFEPIFSFRVVNPGLDQALALPRLRYLELVDPGSITMETPELVKGILQLAETWQEPRLVSALICDGLSEGKAEARNIRDQLERWSVRTEIADGHIPPGCDTHDISWAAFVTARDRPWYSPDPTFAVMWERLVAITDANDRSGRASTIRQLEALSPPFAFENVDFRQVFQVLCDLAHAKDRTNWQKINECCDPGVTVSFATYEWERLPVRVLLSRAVFATFGERTVWRVTETGDLEIERLPQYREHCQAALDGGQHLPAR